MKLMVYPFILILLLTFGVYSEARNGEARKDFRRGFINSSKVRAAMTGAERNRPNFEKLYPELRTEYTKVTSRTAVKDYNTALSLALTRRNLFECDTGETLVDWLLVTIEDRIGLLDQPNNYYNMMYTRNKGEPYFVTFFNTDYLDEVDYVEFRFTINPDGNMITGLTVVEYKKRSLYSNDGDLHNPQITHADTIEEIKRGRCFSDLAR